MLLSTSTSHVEKFSIFYSSSSVIPSYLFLFVVSLFYLSTTETHTHLNAMIKKKGIIIYDDIYCRT